MHLWNRLHLKQKILALFVPMTVFSMALILIFSATLVVNSNKKQTIENAEDKLNLVVDQTDSIIRNIKYNVKAFSTENTLHQAINAGYPKDSYGTYLFSTRMKASVYNIMDIGSFIVNGYIHTYDNKIYQIKSDMVSYTPDQAMRTRYQQIAGQGGQIIFSGPNDQSGVGALNLSKSLIDINTGKCLGVLSFDIKESLFLNIYHNLSSTGSEHFFIMDHNGLIVSAQDRTLLRTPADEGISQFAFSEKVPAYKLISIDGVRHLVMAKPITETGWYVVCTVAYRDILAEAVAMASLLLVIGCLVIFLTIVLAQVLAKSIVRPVTKLVNYADEVGQGNLDAVLNIKSGDEIGFLAERFREMVGNVKNLTMNIYIEQKQKREYALNLLQSQVNPHFLYNCLDNISTLIDNHENEVASEMLHHLGKYYKGVLSKGRNIITIHEDIELARDYLQIQKLKDSALFDYKIEVDPGILDYKVLKLLLQPIVENCVIHGFSGYRTAGMIRILGYVESTDVILEVIDDGRGIPTDQVHLIFHENDTAYLHSFGLHNINDRIKLKFGEEYGLTLEAATPEGTRVIIRIPKLI